MKKQIKERSPAGEWAETYAKAYEEGRKQALEEVEKLIDEYLYDENDNYGNWSVEELYEELKSKIKEMKK